jgi:hypothetical protein
VPAARIVPPAAGDFALDEQPDEIAAFLPVQR